MFVTHLYCSACSHEVGANELHNLCPECKKPLMVAHDLKKAGHTLNPDSLSVRVSNLWRYREVLPLQKRVHLITLGEGMTPLLPARRLAGEVGIQNLWIKDESQNPTASFKARGMAMAVSMALELGAKTLALPSAGNAGGALAAYAAQAGLKAVIYMPEDTPAANIIECRRTGAEVHLVDGLITDCGRIMAEKKEAEGWFDVSTLKEPYRIEGKKTMGYEIYEQLGSLPDAIIYPTGGGTGLIGMWKAFDEMEELGWIDEKRPRMYSVQSEGCAPIVRAFEEGKSEGVTPDAPHTVASGLRVPSAIGDFIVIDILKKSGGGAVAVSDKDLMADVDVMGRREGIFAAPEGGATLSALKVLMERGEITGEDRVVLFNTGSGLKYLNLWEK